MSEKKHPLISIIIPTYNRAHYIKDAIESIIAQTYTNWEVIVVDDGSVDDTDEIIKAFQKLYSVKYLQTAKPTSGPSAARNLGIQYSTSELIMFLDSDDLYYTDALMNLYLEYEKHPGIKVVQGFYSSVDENLKPIRTQGIDLLPSGDESYQLPFGHKVDWMTFIRGEFLCSLTTCLFEKSLLDKVGVLNESLGHWEDYEYFIQIQATEPDSIVAVPYYIVKYRHQSSSTSRTVDNTNKMLDSFLWVLDLLFSQSSLPDEAENWKSFSYTRIHRVAARMQLINKRPRLAREISMRALNHQDVNAKQWVKQLLPVFLQSYLPYFMYDRLADLNRFIKLNFLALKRDAIK